MRGFWGLYDLPQVTCSALTGGGEELVYFDRNALGAVQGFRMPGICYNCYFRRLRCSNGAAQFTFANGSVACVSPCPDGFYDSNAVCTGLLSWACLLPAWPPRSRRLESRHRSRDTLQCCALSRTVSFGPNGSMRRQCLSGLSRSPRCVIVVGPLFGRRRRPRGS